MSGNNNPLLPIDYASQNEEWMLINDRLEEQLAALHERDITGNDNDAEETTTETCEEIANLESMLLAARIGRLTNITCAMMDSNASQGKNKTNRNVLKQYLNKTQQEFDTLPEQPLIKLLTMKSNKDQSNDNDDKVNMMETTNPLEEDLTIELQVDAFFEEYPECMRSDYGIGGGNDTDTDNDDDDNDDDVSCDSSSNRTKSSSPQGKPQAKSRRLEKKLTVKSMSTSQQSESAHASIPTARQNVSSMLSKQPTPVIDLVDENVVPGRSVAEQNTSLQPSLQNSFEFEQPISRPPTRDGTENNRPNTFNYTPASQDTMATAIGLESTKTVDQQPSETQWKPQPNTNNNLPPSTGLSTNWGQNHQGTTTAPTKATANPYATKRPQAPTYSQIPPPCSVPPSASSIHNQTAWANHCHQQNPFQTAREMADAEHNSFRNTNHPQEAMASQHHAPPGNTQPRSAMRQWGQQPTPPQPPTDYGFSYQGHGEQPEDSVANSGPHIPESLKRKFQPPKRLANNNTSINNNNSNNNNGPAGGGRPYGPGKGGIVQPRSQSNRPSIPPSSSNGPPNGSNGGGTVSDTTKNDHNTINDDEEELPEELQHLDKELVLKIQNEIMESGETVNFDDIAGLKDAKQTVLEVVVWPMQRPDVFTGLRRAPNGLLLFGPPGTGKTLIGKAIANETKATFFSISSSSLTSKWIGEGEKLVKTLFAVAAYREPAVVFIDEIDSLLTQRKSTENEASRRIKTEFLVQLDGAGTSKQGRVLVIGATNRPQELDEAARRRFTKRMYIPLPVEGDRRVLIQVMLKNNNHKLTEAQIEILAKETEGFSGADLKALCTDAAMGPIRQLGAKAMEVDVKDIPPISFKHFKRSLKGTRPSVAPDDITQYVEWDRVYGSSRSAEEEFDDEDDEEDEDDE